MRRKLLAAAGIVAATLSMSALGTATAAAGTGAAQQGAAVQQAQKAAPVGFDCNVPGRGWNEQCHLLDIPNGSSVYVHLDHSGGKRVDFNLNELNSGNQLGDTAYLNEGQSAFMWTNNTGGTLRAQLRAASPALVTVQAQGSTDIR